MPSDSPTTSTYSPVPHSPVTPYPWQFVNVTYVPILSLYSILLVACNSFNPCSHGKFKLPVHLGPPLCALNLNPHGRLRWRWRWGVSGTSLGCFWTPPRGGAEDMSNWEETTGQTENTLEGLHVTAGLGASWDPLGRAAGCGFGDGCLGYLT